MPLHITPEAEAQLKADAEAAFLAEAAHQQACAEFTQLSVDAILASLREAEEALSLMGTKVLMNTPEKEARFQKANDAIQDTKLALSELATELLTLKFI